VNPPLANTVGASYILYPLRFAIDWRFAPDPVTQVRPMLFLVDSDWAAPTGWGNSGAWQSKDGGNNWSRTLQYFQPWSIDLDPNTGRVYVTGTGTFVGGIYPTAQFSVYSDDGISLAQQSEYGSKAHSLVGNHRSQQFLEYLLWHSWEWDTLWSETVSSFPSGC